MLGGPRPPVSVDALLSLESRQRRRHCRHRPPPRPPTSPPTGCAHRTAGTAEDQRRIERQIKEREEQHKQYEDAKKKAQQGAGLRQFGTASSEVCGAGASASGQMGTSAAVQPQPHRLALHSISKHAVLPPCLCHPAAPPPPPVPPPPPPQAIEHAFKNETVGLVTREQFVEKRLTIEDRLKAEEKRQRDVAEEEAFRVGTGLPA